MGNGTATMAQDFVERFGIGFAVFTDPSREVFRLAGMRRNFGLGLKTLGRGLRAFKGGFRQGRTQGDAWQQGGILGVAPGDVLWFQHADGGAGDHADIDEVLDSLRRFGE